MKEIIVSNPIKLLCQIPLPKKIFEGIEIYEKGVDISLKCSICSSENIININLNTGHLLDTIIDNNILLREEIIKNGIAKESSKIYRYLGSFNIFPNLPVLFSFFKCSYCSNIYLIVYSYGESQPSRDICYISCLWEIKELND